MLAFHPAWKSPDEIMRGVAIDFGSHVAAVWKDEKPLGVLGGNDLVMHHLGGFPEILPLARLATARPSNEAEACRPLRMKRKGVAVLPVHRAIMEEKFGRPRGWRECIVVMMRWGNEYDAEVDEEQRRWTRWLVAHGASTIVRNHPHVIQKLEMYGNAQIPISLGNAVYPHVLKGADSGVVRESEIFCPPGPEN